MRYLVFILLFISVGVEAQNINQLRPDTAAGSIPMTVAPYFRQAYARPETVADTLIKYIGLDSFYITNDTICLRLFSTSPIVCLELPAGGGGSADSLGTAFADTRVILGDGTRGGKTSANLTYEEVSSSSFLNLDGTANAVLNMNSIGGTGRPRLYFNVGGTLYWDFSGSATNLTWSNSSFTPVFEMVQSGSLTLGGYASGAFNEPSPYRLLGLTSTGIVKSVTGANAKTFIGIDGSETSVTAGTGISVSGSGTTGSPYVISNLAVPDGSETKVSAGSGISVSGTGLISDPYVVTNTHDGSETSVTAGTNISVTGSGTSGSPYVITNTLTAADGSETVITSGTNVTVTGTGTSGDPYVVNSTGSADQMGATVDANRVMYGLGTALPGHEAAFTYDQSTNLLTAGGVSTTYIDITGTNGLEFDNATGPDITFYNNNTDFFTDFDSDVLWYFRGAGNTTKLVMNFNTGDMLTYFTPRFFNGIKDDGGSLGSANQILTSTSTDVDWVSPSAINFSIPDDQIVYGDVDGSVDFEAAFTYDESSNNMSVGSINTTWIDITGSTGLEFNNSTGPDITFYNNSSNFYTDFDTDVSWFIRDASNATKIQMNLATNQMFTYFTPRFFNGILDDGGSLGSAGQVLASTGTDIDWITVADNSATNEIQNLGIGTRSSTLYPITISGGSGVNLGVFNDTEAGIVPADGGLSATYFLNAGGTWTIPAGTGDYLGTTVPNNYILFGNGTDQTSYDADFTWSDGSRLLRLGPTAGNNIQIDGDANTIAANSNLNISASGSCTLAGVTGVSILNTDATGITLASGGITDILDNAKIGNNSGDQLEIETTTSYVSLHHDLVDTSYMRFNQDGNILIKTTASGDQVAIESANYIDLESAAGTTINGGSSDNLAINGAVWGNNAHGVIAIYNGTAPTTSATDAVQLYAQDVTTSELRVRDEAGNITTLSPHNFSEIPEGPSEEMAWSFYSERDGKYINVDMLKAIRTIEKQSSEIENLKAEIAELKNLIYQKMDPVKLVHTGNVDK